MVMPNYKKIKNSLVIVLSCLFSTCLMASELDLLSEVKIIKNVLSEKKVKTSSELFEEHRLKVKTVRILEVDGGGTRGAVSGKVLGVN